MKIARVTGKESDHLTSVQESIKNRNKRKSILFYLRKDWQLYILLLVPVAFAFIFKYGSMFGLVVAFKDYKILKGFSGSEWVGLSVFRKVFQMRDFGKSIRNTLLLNSLTLIIGFPLPILLALLLNEVKNKYFKKLTQTLLYLPHFLSFVIIGAIAYQIFGLANGVINNLLEATGHVRIPFLQEDNHWLITYVLINVWQTMGWGTIIYLAAITSVNPELYEAATVDGAGRLAKCIHVTLPCIKSTIVILLIMNLGKIMGGSFESVNALMNVATTEYTNTIPVLVYRLGLSNGKYSEATAIGLFQSVIGLLLVIGSDFFAKKLGEEGIL
ncbi:ABC transporter permease subunit [Anaerocolumna sedimenticola]|uniref:ABC transporter permease subunit n=1 Tax=Anaerocolumna sedimenticola TaxID=2696063 RepID=A0A6P1TI11_9FIRM|nr:ABC transporter permease subunit [Anaerocolumna sedimenticola]QHQ59937.1 ABC transporter permease subunit [Anaerocolumna sedimenticola]